MINRIRFTTGVLLLTLIPQFISAADQTAQKVVYHLDAAANARWAMLLARAHLGQNERAQIVVVAHGPGIDFLLEDAEDRSGNPYEPDVMELTTQGVRFSICEATPKVREIDPARVIEGVARIPSGAYEIVRLQTEEDYAYLKP